MSLAVTTGMAADLLTVEGLETVTSIVVKTQAGSTITNTTHNSVANCLRFALSKEQVQFYGAGGVEGQHMNWSIPVASIPGVTLRPGDTITASGETWVMLAVDLLGFRTRWRAVCRKVRT